MYSGLLADCYDTIYGTKDYKSEAEFIVASAEFHLKQSAKGMKLLDYGCGTGNHGVHLAKKFGKYLGLDPSERMLAIAQKKLSSSPNVTLISRLVDLMPTEKESIDILCFLFSVIGHIGSVREFERTLEEVLPLMSRNSIILLDFWDKDKLDEKYGNLRERDFNLGVINFRKTSQGIINRKTGQVLVQTSIENKQTGEVLEYDESAVFAFSSHEIQAILNKFEYLINLDVSDGESGSPWIDGKSRWIIGKRTSSKL